MSRYSIGEVADLLRVKPHILRYWEQEIDVLSPIKDDAGRRTYSRRDLALLYRLKYLINTRKFTVEGAGERLLSELDGETADAKARVQETRDALFSVRDRMRRPKEAVAQPGGESVPGELVSWLRDCLSRGPRSAAPAVRLPKEPGGRLARAGEALLRAGAVALVVRLDELVADLAAAPFVPVTPVRGASLLQLWLEEARRVAYTYGRTPLVVFAVRNEKAPRLRAYLEEAGHFGMPSRRVAVLPVPDFPVVAEDGRVPLGPNGRLRLYPAGLAGVLWALSRAKTAPILGSVKVVTVAPVTNPFVEPFSPELVALPTAPSYQACFRVTGRDGTKVRLLDAFAVSTEVLEGDWERGVRATSDLRADASDAENVVRRLRLSVAGLASLGPSAVRPMPAAALTLCESTHRTLEELVDDLVGAMALYGAALHDEGGRGRRKHAEFDRIYAAAREEAVRRREIYE